MIRKLTEEEKIEFFKNNAEIWENTGAAIKEMRVRLRISKRKLAKKAGISVKTLTKLENGCYIRRFKTVSKACLNGLEAINNKDSLICLEQQISLS